MSRPSYYVESTGLALRVLRVLAESPIPQRTLTGLVKSLNAQRNADDEETSEFKVRSALATLEAEGFVHSCQMDGIALYGAGPLLAILTYHFFERQRAQLDTLIRDASAMLGRQPGGEG